MNKMFSEFINNHKTIILILFIGFLLRFSFFLVVKPWNENYIYDKIIMVDAGPYHEFALNILKNKSFSSVDAYRTPGYPVYLWLVYSIFGIKPWVAVFLQIFMGTFIILLVYIWSRLWFRKSVSAVAAASCAIDPHAIIYGACLLTETLFVFVFLSSIIIWLYGIRNKRVSFFFVSAFLLGIATLVRPISFVFPVVVLAMSLAYGKLNHSFKIKSLIGYAVIFFLTLFPWLHRNYTHYGHFSLTHINGFNLLFVSAAYTEVARTDKPFTTVENEFNIIAREKGIENSSNPFVKSDIYRKIAFEYILRHPISYLKRNLLGMVTMFTNVASTDTADLLGLKRIQYKYNVYEFHNIFRMIQWYFKNKGIYEISIGLIIISYLFATYLMFLFGASDAVKKKNFSCLAINFSVLSYFLLLTGVFGVARYRLPLIPFYILFSANGAHVINELISRRRVVLGDLTGKFAK